MILIDANLLLYAYDPRSTEHERSRQWLEQTLSGSELVRFTSATLWAFLRIATNPRVFEHPLTVTEALDAVTSWLAQPIAAVVDPGERHWDVLRDVAREGQASGPMVMDAVWRRSPSSMVRRCIRPIATSPGSRVWRGRTR